jgi:hypothetical protein
VFQIDLKYSGIFNLFQIKMLSIKYTRPSIRVRAQAPAQAPLESTDFILKRRKPRLLGHISTANERDGHTPYYWQTVYDWKGYVRDFMRTARNVYTQTNTITDDTVNRLVMDVKMANKNLKIHRLMIDTFRAWRNSKVRLPELDRGEIDKVYLKSTRDIIKLMLKKSTKARIDVHAASKQAVVIINKHKYIDNKKNILREWRQIADDARKVVLEPLPEIDNPMTYIKVKLNVLKKSGKIKVRLSAPLDALYSTYHANGKLMPIGDKIRAYSDIGYPNWFLEKMLMRRDLNVSRKPMIEAMISDVFDKYLKNKPAKVKEKTLTQKLNTRRKRV